MTDFEIISIILIVINMVVMVLLHVMELFLNKKK